MEYAVKDLVREVRIVLDENGISDALAELGDTDTLTLDEMIESRLAPSATWVEEHAPHALLDRGDAFGDSIGWKSHEGNGMGWILLPKDFLRLVTFQMSDWSRAVTAPISEQDPRYAMQQSRYPGVRGNPQKPVAAVVQQEAGKVLEFYSCAGGKGTHVKRARYIPLPKISDGKIKVCERLKDAAVYHAAYLTAAATGAADKAASMLSAAKEMMEGV